MASYIKFFEDFLQKKENDVQSNSSINNNNNTNEDDEENANSSTTETVPSPKASLSPSPPSTKKMEHSYMRDTSVRSTSSEASNGLTPARTILVRRPPQCPSCHTHPMEEHDLEDEVNQVPVPSYNEIGAKEAMNECARIAKYVKNINPDDEDWEGRVNQTGWSNLQKTIFEKVSSILDDDQLERLATMGSHHEAMYRRATVDRSAARMRKLLASVAWDTRMTQWLHCLLMDCLPSTYMASYLDILQTLKTKLPLLMDKMLFGRPLNISQELLAPVMKKKWEPQFNTKTHKLQQNAVIVALPSMPTSGAIPSRLQKWYQQLASITQIVQITLPMINNHTNQQPLEQIAEQIVSLTRVKIQELRNENPMRSIILIGFNAGAALALQVAMSENLACVVCMGFAYNTIKGVRGTPEDRILDLKVPILFVIGQNSARTSQEEIESLREKMQSETSLVIVGSADDYLRVPKIRRRIENVTQAMVDAMVVDEVYEFIKEMLANPPGSRIPAYLSGMLNQKHGIRTSTNAGEKNSTPLQRKRKQDGGLDNEIPSKTKHTTNAVETKEIQISEPAGENEKPFKKPKAAKKPVDPNQPKRKVGRPRTRPLPAVTAGMKAKQVGGAILSASGKLTAISAAPSNANDDINMAMQSLLGGDSGTEQDDSLATTSDAATTPSQAKLVTNYELVSPTKAGLLNKSGLLGSSGTTPLGATKIKMIPSNQFLQIKPQQLQTQSKIYTIKTTSPASVVGGNQSESSSIGSIVRTSNLAASGQQQIFTLKSPNGKTTQFVTAAPGSAQQKYTVIKNATGSTMLQLTTAKNVATAVAAAASTEEGTSDKATTSASSRMDISNIIDMPILFADNDGNLTDTTTVDEPTTKPQLIVNKPSTSSGVGQLIISQKIIKEANTSSSTSASTLSTAIGTTKGGAYVISKPGGRIIPTQQLHNLANKSITPTGATATSNKVVFINRNTMKPCPNIISRSNMAQNFPKYAKVVVSNAKSTSSPLIARSNVQLTTNTTSPAVISSPSSIVSNVKHLNLQTLKSTLNITGASGTATRTPISGNIISLAGKPVQIINKTATGTGNAAASDKPTIIRNIVVKPGNLKQIPPHLTSQLLNRNLTVRKLVNFIPGSGIITAAVPTVTTVASQLASTTATDANSQSQTQSPTTSIAAAAATATTSTTPNSSSIQTTPKIITLNPVNTAQPKSD